MLFVILIFSMALVTHWLWNLGVLILFVLSRWLWLPVGSEILFLFVCFVFSMAFAIPYVISAVRFLRFPRACLTECSLHAHGMPSGMSNGMLPGCLARCQDSVNPACSQPDTSSPIWQCVLSKLMLHELLHGLAQAARSSDPSLRVPEDVLLPIVLF